MEIRVASAPPRAVIAPIAAAALLLFGSTASAHQASFTYAQVEVSEDRRVAEYQIQINSRDLFEALGLDSDRDATSAEILAGGDRLYDYALARIDVEADVDGCDLARRPVEVVEERERFARLAIELRCPRPIAELAIDYTLFFDLDDLHTGLLRVDGELVHLRRQASRFVYTVGEPPPSGILGFVRSGIDHILFGLDHILFLFSLLLMVTITRDPGGGWRLRPMREGLAYTAIIVTSFTLAHSVTLIAAAMGWIELPERLVESVIAASIIYVAVENVVRPDPPRRYLVTFLFGLIHGLGFASMLRPLLPPEGVVLPLLAFNVGVEVGQLGVVLLAMPLLYGAARALGADRYRAWVLPGGAAALGALGLLWLIERAFDLAIFGF